MMAWSVSWAWLTAQPDWAARLQDVGADGGDAVEQGRVVGVV